MLRAWQFTVVLAVVTCAHAEKKLSIKLPHPAVIPGLAGTQVALGTVTGPCGQEFADMLLGQIRAHAAGAGGGPVTTISINVTRCEAHTLAPILEGGLPAMHISRTEGDFLATVTAGSTPVSVHGHAQKENQSQTSDPEYPSAAEVKQLALKQALAEAQRLYAPWVETREIPFPDSKECGLKQAYETARSGDYQKLASQARASVDSCGEHSKDSAAAYYVLGVSSMLVQKYDDAVAALQKAVEWNGGKLVGGMLDEARRESAAAHARQPAPPPAATPPAREQTGIVLTNDFIIKLVDGNIAEDEILKMIANQPGRFSVAPEDIAKLRAAKVPEAVIQAMRDKK